jgi:hypothetical protein
LRQILDRVGWTLQRPVHLQQSITCTIRSRIWSAHFST